MGNPTTVLGWLETLPEPLRNGLLPIFLKNEMLCTNLADAVYLANATIGMTYWMGVECYLRGKVATGNVNAVNGYNAAKSAFEGQSRPVSVRTDYGSGASVGYIDILPERLKELEEIARKYKAIMEVINGK